MFDRPGEAPGGVYRDVGVMAIDLHPQMDGGVSHKDADGAQADNT